MIRVTAFDLSLVSTGIADIARDGTITTHRFRPKTKGWERLEDIEREMRYRAIGADICIVEEPAWGAKGKTFHQLAGGWWAGTKGIWHAVGADRILQINNQKIKKYATGNGNADKDLVLAAAIRRFTDVELAGNDEADALWAGALLRRWFGHPIDNVPQVNQSVLDTVDWPAHLREDITTP